MLYFFQCLNIYTKPLQNHIRKLTETFVDNEVSFTFYAAAMTGVLEILKKIWGIDVFGVSNYLVFLVLGTIFTNAVTGVWKTKTLAKEYLQKAHEELPESANFKRFMALAKSKTFSARKLNYVFFKVLSFLFYLHFAKSIFDDPEGFLDFTLTVMVKVPLVIFWYFEFKSIGDNSEVIYGKKPSIFRIIEGMFEWRIKDLFKKDKNEPSI